jgi:hypothetical protein
MPLIMMMPPSTGVLLRTIAKESCLNGTDYNHANGQDCATEYDHATEHHIASVSNPATEYDTRQPHAADDIMPLRESCH